MSVEWFEYSGVEEDLDPIVLERVEREIGYRFPVDYRESVQSFQGRTPEPSIFHSATGFEGSVACLLHFSENERIYSFFQHWNRFEPGLKQSGIVPFAVDSGGNHLCFDYRGSDDAPTVVFSDHEMLGFESLSHVAPNFSEFLQSLKELE